MASERQAKMYLGSEWGRSQKHSSVLHNSWHYKPAGRQSFRSFRCCSQILIVAATLYGSECSMGKVMLLEKATVVATVSPRLVSHKCQNSQSGVAVRPTQHVSGKDRWTILLLIRNKRMHFHRNSDFKPSFSYDMYADDQIFAHSCGHCLFCAPTPLHPPPMLLAKIRVGFMGYRTYV